MLDPDHLLLTVQYHYGRQFNFVKQLSGLDVTSWLVRDVTSEKTEKFVIKIAPDKKEKDFSKELSYRQCMMQRLLDSGLICPRLVPTVSGQTRCLYTSPNNVTYTVHLLTYIDGMPLSKQRPTDAEECFRLGKFVGEIRQALKLLNIPGLEDHHSDWNIEKLGNCRQHLNLFEKMYFDDNVTEVFLKPPLDKISIGSGIGLPAEREILTKALDMNDGVLAPNICNLERGAIHNDLHDDNILILEKDSAMARTDPTDLKSSPYSDYGLVDFGDIVVSCTLFDLVTFLESIMRDHAAPPKEYVEHMRTVMDEACDGSQRPGQGRHLTPIDQPMYKGSDEKDADVLPPGILLVGHALVGYLTTCPLSPLEWKVLFTAICARVALYLILLRVCLPEFRDDLPRVLDPIWNGMPLLRDLLALGEDRVLRSWKAICQDHGIAVP